MSLEWKTNAHGFVKTHEILQLSQRLKVNKAINVALQIRHTGIIQIDQNIIFTMPKIAPIFKMPHHKTMLMEESVARIYRKHKVSPYNLHAPR